MALKKKSQRPVSNARPDQYEAVTGRTDDGHELPGIAGYKGIEQLPKGAMPVSRFVYRRPDGKE